MTVPATWLGSVGCWLQALATPQRLAAGEAQSQQASGGTSRASTGALSDGVRLGPLLCGAPHAVALPPQAGAACCPASCSPHNTVSPCCPATCSDTGATNACMPAVGELRRLECCNLSFTGVYCEHTNGC